MSDQATLTERAAEEIRAMLARKRMSGRELARQLEVSQAWVSYRLTGHQEIGLNDLERIAAALGVEVASLLPAAPERAGSGRPRSWALDRPAVACPDGRAPAPTNSLPAVEIGRPRRPVRLHAGVTR